MDGSQNDSSFFESVQSMWLSLRDSRWMEGAMGAAIGCLMVPTLLFGGYFGYNYYLYYSTPEKKDAPYLTSGDEVTEEMIDLSALSQRDTLYDLGSGDGRIPIRAAEQTGAYGVGVEIDSALVHQSRDSAREEGLAESVEIRKENFFETDLGDASVVTLFLYEEVNVKLRPKLLRELDPGDRIVAHQFGMGDWEPDSTVGVNGRKVMMWTVPENPPKRLLEVPDQYQE